MDGILIIDKPEGITSHGVINLIRRAIVQKKVGHCGTLDPFATGVLPILIGKATRFSQLFTECDKEYDGIMKLGIETDTFDVTGKTVSICDIPEVDENDIYNAFEKFQGRIKQIPPMYSAVKFNGIPLYKFARQGIEVERKERWVEIYSLKITKLEMPFISFSIHCSKGTYVRTIVNEIGKSLGYGAILYKLKRIRSGNFNLSDAVELNKFLISKTKKFLYKEILMW